RVTTDPHSPPFLRVDLPVSNSPDFQAAFQCKAGSKMVRASRCEVW
ncbi:MAG TPA: M13-type metalloendopeptidase, partial [Myxococcaceae bacterium]|nr:M13-type metalloendopeptidase [Myxococcaceae bacterium]